MARPPLSVLQIQSGLRNLIDEFGPDYTISDAHYETQLSSFSYAHWGNEMARYAKMLGAISIGDLNHKLCELANRLISTTDIEMFKGSTGMALVEFRQDSIELLQRYTFSEANIKERQDIQRLLRTQIELVAPDVYVIAEEFGDWDASKRRIDLLGIDKSGSLVIIELKRTEDGGHMDLQALRYAAMVSAMTWHQAVEAHAKYRANIGENPEEAEDCILEFLEWDEPKESAFAQDVRIVLVSADFHPEVTTAVLWLNTRGLDIRCVKLSPYSFGDRLLVNIQPIIPLPEAQEYQVRIREKEQRELIERTSSKDYTKFDLTLGAVTKQGLNKRQAVLEAVRYLFEQGIGPEALLQAVPSRTEGRPLLKWVDGELDQQGFLEHLASGDSQAQENLIERFFSKTELLLKGNGITCAVSNQWGKDTDQALKELSIAFSDRGFSYCKAGSN